MQFRRNPDYQSLRDEVTPEHVFLDRRQVLAAAGFGGAAFALGGGAALAQGTRLAQPEPGAKLAAKASAFKIADPLTSEEAVTGYNNFYEFGTNKSDPARNAGRMTVSNWKVTVEGEAERTGEFALTDVVDYSRLEERIYRLRCVEAWSMVIPWVGVPMSSVLSAFKPKATAKYVQFVTYLNKKEMPGTLMPVLKWPYVEGLRMDEAMNELAFMAVGVYGKGMPKQNGAPIRAVLPWKYGFKSAKSIVRIRFVTKEPETSWNLSAPQEYGFYSNVNPTVDHPRWSQSSERIIDGKPFTRRRDTDMFNGYAKQVEKLYAGMDLKKLY
jgi:methionine sulfoxide reductase catalytic subunit